ncbi:hypothetical protein IAT38_004887 [Cryptococcus sp. DSM 104549]
MSNDTHPNIPTKNLDLSLPSRPATHTGSRPSIPIPSRAVAASSALPTPISSLPSRPTFALPSRPNFAPPSSSSRIPRGLRASSPSSPAKPARQGDDFYRPRQRSPSPSRFRSRSPERGPSRYRNRSPSPIPPSRQLQTDSYRPDQSSKPKRKPGKRGGKGRRGPLKGRARSPSARQSHSPSPALSQQSRHRELRSESRERRTASPRPSYIREQEQTSSVRLGDRSDDVAAEKQTLKRPLSPSAQSEQPAKLPALSIPTGPRGTTIPTGPRALASQPQSTPQTQTGSNPQNHYTQPVSQFRGSRPLTPDSSEMPGPSRYRGHGSSRRNAHSSAASGRSGGSGASAAGGKPLSPPLNDAAQIQDQYGNGVKLKSQWAENPKAPLANFLGGGKGGADLNSLWKVEEGVVAGKKIFRVSVEPVPGVLGVGDHATRKEAEKLASLSAVLQLQAQGILESGKAGGKPVGASGASTPKFGVASNSSPADTGGSSDTATLSDGSVISYDRARQFMEYYCQKYQFRKPDLEYSQTAVKNKRGKSAGMVWDAVITVGDRRIGMGSANNKKNAQIKCYLDVTQYLESCDPDLWRDFIEYSKKDTSADLGMAPRLIFQMSDTLNDDIQALCGDIRYSKLWANAPPPGVAGNDSQPLPTWHSGPQGRASEGELAEKSQSLQERLAAYQSDPKLEKMRQTREALPVTSRATEILAKIEVNDVTIVMAATGSGKTTQVPQLLFDDYINRGEGAKCNIVCTQPRRLAAMSVAERIADERGQSIGDEVGYQVRFDAKLPKPNGSITFCTTGIFLKRMQSALSGSGAVADPAAVARMDEVTHIVVDEVHERDIDTDLLLVVLKRLLADRRARKKPLKIILMSATIDPTLFQTYFLDPRGRAAPVAEVPGRTFPVERHYLDSIVADLQNTPSHLGGWVFREKNVMEYCSKELSPNPAMTAKGTGMELEIPYPLVALTVASVLKQSEDGHVLVFLPGWDEIKKVAEILQGGAGHGHLLGLNFSDTRKFSIHYLHSTIPADEQKAVFRPPPPGVRRIILATNIAETSVTIPDVVYVVDTARVKEKRYDPERHMSSLVTAWVGASNLNQRAGRAGRHREGEYYGLVSNNRLASLDTHQLVEMKRSDLSNVVMHVKALNLGKVEEVLEATIEPPEANRIVAAMDVLRMLGALDAHQNLTSLGRVLLQLPVEAAIGKLCLYGSFFRCLDSALTLAAVLTNRDPFLAPMALKMQADQIKDSWSPRAFRSDPLAIVAAYNAWVAFDNRGDYRAGTAFCSENFLSKPTMLQIKQVKQSLLQSLDQAGVIAVSAGGAVGRIGRHGGVPPVLNEHGQSLPLLAALIALANAPNFAIRTSDKTCRTSQDKTVFIHNSSVNSRRRETGGPVGASASFNPNEKRLYAFGEKARNVPLGGNPNSGITQLRTVTRLDPMTYMLFGAYELVVTQRGLECDGWLPVVGNLNALDDVQRLKQLLDGCMLRVFEGVGKSLVRGRDQRWRQGGGGVEVHNGTSRIREEGGGEEENESDDEDDLPGKDKEKTKTRVAEPLSFDEIKELELLTTDVVRILDAYGAERGDSGGMDSRPDTRPGTPGAVDMWGESNGAASSAPTGPMFGAPPPAPRFGGNGFGGGGHGGGYGGRGGSFRPTAGRGAPW